MHYPNQINRPVLVGHHGQEQPALMNCEVIPTFLRIINVSTAAN